MRWLDSTLTFLPSFTTGEAKSGREEVCQDWTTGVQRCIRIFLSSISCCFPLKHTFVLNVRAVAWVWIQSLLMSVCFTCCSYEAERPGHCPAQFVLPGWDTVVPYFRDQSPHLVSDCPRIIAAPPEGLNEINTALV